MKNNIVWDSHQRKVISASKSDRIIVDAGPGTGKTAVACKRLAHLITEWDLEPTNTWMISFTRAAVKEILNRLHHYVGDDSYGVGVATIDSHAWAIHSGFSSTATLTGAYEDNIERVIELLKSNEDLAEELSEIEHVVIDEAQDIVGVRADFIEVLVHRLSPTCGVTIFVDEAQAIYSFSDERVGKRQSSVIQSLHKRLRVLKDRNFSTRMLKTVHRTSEPNLKSVFSDLREDIIDPGMQKHGIHERVASRIRELANENLSDDIKISIDDFPRNTLVLYRSRSEVLLASQFSKEPHRVRMSEYNGTLPFWLAQCFWDYTDPYLQKEKFIELWMERVPEKVRQTSEAELRWQKLESMATYNEAVIDMHRLRTRLSQIRPPIELATREFGFGGPIAGTIHASKGRESSHTVLLLPSSAKFRDLEDEIEEARVLFVGATRAKSSLVVRSAGSEFNSRTLSSGRVFRSPDKDKVQIEIGREGDIQAEGLVGKKKLGKEGAKKAQCYLSERAGKVSTYRLEADPSIDWNYRIKTDDGNLCLGVLAPQVKDDVWNILLTKGQSDVKVPPISVPYLKSLGSRTLVLSDDDPELALLHKPWASSGFMLVPRILSLPPFKYLWKRLK